MNVGDKWRVAGTVIRTSDTLGTPRSRGGDQLIHGAAGKKKNPGHNHERVSTKRLSENSTLFSWEKVKTLGFTWEPISERASGSQQHAGIQFTKTQLKRQFTDRHAYPHLERIARRPECSKRQKPAWHVTRLHVDPRSGPWEVGGGEPTSLMAACGGCGRKRD